MGLSFLLTQPTTFQSTLPRGERPHRSHRRHRRWQISIHAPARGATFGRYGRSDRPRRFQSTLPRGERPLSTLQDVVNFAFQSTLPRGERLSDISVGLQIDISIHAPARGATYNGGDWNGFIRISIHAPARGATRNED